MLDIKITRTTAPKAKPTGKLGFGSDFHRPHVRDGLHPGPGLARPASS